MSICHLPVLIGPPSTCRRHLVGKIAQMSSAEIWPARVLRLPPPRTGNRRAEGGLRMGPQGPKSLRPGEPLVSYVTVVRNAEETLARALRSVREQRWKHVEHILVDGKSTDGTLAIIEEHAGQIDYFVSEPDGGLYDALNKAISLARGDLICVLSADDWLTSDAALLAAQTHLAAGPAEARLILGAAWAHAAGSSTLWLPRRLDLGCYFTCANVCHNAVYATPQAYRASGPYATNLRIAADFRWLMACVDAGVHVVAIGEPTVHYSMGGLSSDVHQHTLDCAQVLHERFPSLREAEVWGLLHAFFSYREHLREFAETRPQNMGRFLFDVIRARGREPDFIRAVALASLGRLRQLPEGARRWRASRLKKIRRTLRKAWK